VALTEGVAEALTTAIGEVEAVEQAGVRALPPDVRHLLDDRPRNCGCLYFTLVLYCAQLTLSMLWLLLSSPLTLRSVRLPVGAIESDCSADLSLAARELLDWCCKSSGVGCDRGYVSVRSFVLLQLVCATLAVVIPIACAILNKLYHKPILDHFEKIEQDVLGVTLRVNHFYVQALTGVICIEDVQVGNPQGFESPNLATIGRILIDVDMGAAICSFGKRKIFTKMALEDVHMTVEIRGLETNLMVLKKHLDEQKAQRDEIREKHPEGEKSLPSKVLVQQVVVSGLQVNTHMSEGFLKVNTATHLPKLEHQDFSAETGTETMPACVRELVHELILKVLHLQQYEGFIKGLERAGASAGKAVQSFFHLL